VALAPVLLLASALIAFQLPLVFRLTLLLYYAVTLAYSLSLKRRLLVDVHCLGALYTIRVIAGGTATGIPVSFWLLAFSMFLFLSLALAKRYSELYSVADLLDELPGRRYRRVDLQTVAMLGSSSAVAAVLVFALYINSAQVTELYSAPSVLWLLCPLLLYWTTRIWIIACRGKMDVDPIVFALRDRVSYFVGMLAALVLVLGAYGPVLLADKTAWLQLR
jgi:4-hydroxybenzoate polyprenyltransferase